MTLSPDLELNLLTLNDIADFVTDYGKNEIANTLLVLHEGGFIEASYLYTGTCISELLVSRITYNGYQLIENIRPESVWNKLKAAGIKVGSLSLSALSQVAVSLITSGLHAQLSL